MVKLRLPHFRWLHRRGLSRKKMRGGFLHSKLGDRLLDKALWRASPEPIARAWLIGIPITMIPFLPGQSIIAGVLGFLFRANLMVAVALQFIVSNPLTAPIQLPACYIVGTLVLNRSFSKAWESAQQLNWTAILAHPFRAAQHVIIPLYLGAIILGLTIGIIGYFVILAWGNRIVAKKAAKVEGRAGDDI